MFESARTNSGTAKRGRPDQAIEIFPSLCVDEQGGCFQLRPMKVEPASSFRNVGFPNGAAALSGESSRLSSQRYRGVRNKGGLLKERGWSQPKE